MAFETCDPDMRTSQRITRGVVIEWGKGDSLRMTTGAIGADTGGAMIGIFRGVIILDMTRDTGDIETLPCSFFCVFMAVRTIERAMESSERETGFLMKTIVIAYYGESYRLMAPCAIFSQFSVMYVLVALETITRGA
jgi:hypothetical protein